MLASQQGDFGLNISSGLIRHQDGTFGVYVLLGFAGWGDGGPLRNVLLDESGAPVSFATEREVQIAAFGWIEDIRRDIVSRPPWDRPGASEGEIERVDERPDI
jgi:hypothetical protein